MNGVSGAPAPCGGSRPCAKNDVHEAQFPLELPRRLIRLLSDPEEVVLDCFIGSGTTAIAALMENRQFIGIEIVPEYAQLAQQRVAAYLNNRQETLCF
jgi:DNA modification methylase